MQEVNFKNGKEEGLYKWYYESGALEREENYKNGKKEGLYILYSKHGDINVEIHYSNDKPISGKCSNGRKWNNAELSNWEKGLDVYCGY